MGNIDERAKEFTNLIIALRSKMLLKEMNLFTSKIGTLSIRDITVIFLLFQVRETKMRDLAAVMHIPNSTMTGIIDRLSKAGYAQRSYSETDRRVILVSLTREGHDFYADIMKKTVDLYRIMLNSISEEEQVTMLDLFRKMITGYMQSENKKG